MKTWLNAGAALVLACATVAWSEPAQQLSTVRERPRAGASLESALAALNAQGYRIVYSSALVSPAMTVRVQPKATQIDLLLAEILAPWHLRAVHAANGDWLIVGEASGDATADPPPAVSDHQEAVEGIETVDVTASRMRLATPGSSETFLDRAAVERLPHLADDAVRMLKVMPGVSGGDFAAALNVRGGRREETALLIDGAEIHNGFHFRDIDGALSVLDTNLVQSIDFITGGMTAEQGDYMSAIVGMASKRPQPDDAYRNGVGVSFVSAYAHSSGFFANDRGSWLLSARRGFLDVLTAQMTAENEQLTPRYSDVFGSVNLQIGDSSTLAVRLLLSGDDLRFVTDDPVDDADSAGKGHSAHSWATFEHEWAPELHSTTMLSASTMNQVRNSSGRDKKRSGDVASDNDFRFFDLRQDVAWQLGDGNLIRAGINLGRQDGSYDYSLVGSIYDPLVTPQPIEISYATVMDVRLQKVGAFATWRTRLGASLTGEAGLRWDQYRYQPGNSYSVLSPRLNVVYSFDADSELRAAWSVMHQAQGVNELQVEDNVTTFFEPEQSQQLALGYARHFDRGLSIRVDVYDKRYTHLRARYENALDPLQLIPEGAVDRVRIDAPQAHAQGIELTLRRTAERGFAGWASLAYALAEDKDQGYWTPRSWEQQVTLSLGSSWTSEKWNLSLTGLFHSGTPTTSLSLEEIGPRNGDRLATYARIDLRASRDVQLERSVLAFYMEITNLLNAKNECCIESYDLAENGNGMPYLDVQRSYGFPLLPSFGFRWEF